LFSGFGPFPPAQTFLNSVPTDTRIGGHKLGVATPTAVTTAA
jgi:hypothetical protein